MIALGYGVAYIWGTVDVVLVSKYLPVVGGQQGRREGVRGEVRVANVDDVGLSGYRPGGLRAYRLENPKTAG